MVDAPEWIRVAQDGSLAGLYGGFWTTAAATDASPKYIRADLVDARIATLEAQLAERVKVKALEWAQHPTAEAWRADIMLGTYQVWVGTHGTAWQFDGLLGERINETASDEEEAKAAAQADYERRILSALEPDHTADAATRPSEQAVTEEMVEAVVKAIRPYTRDTLFLDEHQILVRAALKAAMEAGRPALTEGRQDE